MQSDYPDSPEDLVTAVAYNWNDRVIYLEYNLSPRAAELWCWQMMRRSEVSHCMVKATLTVVSDA